MVLQGLTFAPSGAVVAAATTSLPEELGSELNWDYRFAWLRDLSLTLEAQWVAACPDEAGRFFGWVADAMGQLGERSVQIMYGVEGERDLTEHTLDHLGGYGGSRPVRVGNDAWDQHQLDVLGEVLYAAHLLREQLGELDTTTRDLLVGLADQARRRWREPDAGMWEARDETRHYVSSKVMCWVALDRAVRLSDRLGPDADPEGWAEARDEVRAAVLDRAGARRPAPTPARSAPTSWTPRSCCCPWWASSRPTTCGCTPRSTRSRRGWRPTAWSSAGPTTPPGS